MPVALLITDTCPNYAKVVALIMKNLSLALGSIKDCIAAAKPIFVCDLFDRRDREFADKLLSLLVELDNLDCRWRLVELVQNQTYSPNEKYFEFDVSRLKNRIESRKRSLKEQEDLGWLQDGSPEE